MAPETKNRGGKYATTVDYVAARTGIRKPYIPAENRIVKALVGSALAGGLSYSDAVRLGVGVYKELDLLARDENSNILNRTAMKDIREYCREIMKSGQTFSAFEIATRAVSAWRMTLDELAKLHVEWDKETVDQRMKLRAARRAKAEGIGAMAKRVGEDEERGLVDTDMVDTSLADSGVAFGGLAEEYGILDVDSLDSLDPDELREMETDFD